MTHDPAAPEKSLAPFVAITSSDGMLYALDRDGHVWVYYRPGPRDGGPTGGVWRRVPHERSA